MSGIIRPDNFSPILGRTPRFLSYIGRGVVRGKISGGRTFLAAATSIRHVALSPQPIVNTLLIGTADKTARLLEITKPGFLLIDDGEIADAFLEKFRAREFDPHLHSFNPLRAMDYKRARDFAQILYTASPEGEHTLTVRNGKRALARLVLNADRLDRIRSTREEDEDAIAAIDDALFSPVLKRVLCSAAGFSFKGSVIARINRAELGDFDSFILACLLIGQAKGHVILPDGGFYLRDMHTALIRQNRLTVGLTFLAELTPKLQQAVLSIKDKEPLQSVFDDADTLAKFAGYKRGDQGYADFIQGAMQ